MLNEIKYNPTDKKFYELSVMTDVIDGLLGYDQRDAGKHFDKEGTCEYEYAKLKGYDLTSSDPEYNKKVHAEYKELLDSGKIHEQVYMDFWLWQLDHCIPDNYSNDSYSALNIHPDRAKNAEDWQKEIQQAWWDTFKDIADQQGWINIST